jgi:threonine/homoserine/homoserine lactone efflux protein
MGCGGLEPTMYELSGDGGTQVSYATVDVQGRAQLLYTGPHGERTYPEEEIDARETELGREVTVTLQADEDADTVNLTLLIPPVRVGEEGAATLETVAVLTTMVSPLTGPPTGQDYRYEVLSLRGRALCARLGNRPVPDPSTLLLFAVASLALLAIPGPAVIYVVTRSLDQGRAAGIVSMLGVETGTFAYALAAAAGLTGVIAASATAFTVVRYAGAAYLLYLGARKLLEREEAHDVVVGSGRSRLFLRGMLVQLLNPKIAIFFVAFLPQFVHSSRGPIALQILVLGTLFTLLAVLSDGAYVVLAGTVGGWIRTGGRARGWLTKLSGGVYIGLGLTAALSGGGHSRPSSG